MIFHSHSLINKWPCARISFLITMSLINNYTHDNFFYKNFLLNQRYQDFIITKNVSWPTVVESDPKAPFSIAIALRCRIECISFPWIAPLTLDPYLIMLSFKQWDIKYHFLDDVSWVFIGFFVSLQRFTWWV